jgi:predicted nucleic acid-binding protein
LILADTTVLNNFAQIGRPDLLQLAYPRLAAPRVVREELARGEQLGLVLRGDWSWLELLDLTDVEKSRAADLERLLQAGEAACLAIAETRNGTVLTDDGAARRFAASLQLETSGTIGALVKLVRNGVLTLHRGDTLLTEMVSRGYRSPIRSLREVLPA